MASSVAVDYTDRVWNQKDLSALDTYLDDQIIIHSLLGGFHGKEKMLEVITAWQQAFPDLVVKNIHVVSGGELSIVHWSAQGTHRREFQGKAPSGKQVSYSGVSIYKVQGGKIIEYWAYLDMNHLLEQL